jgi:predicted nucleic acid-binding protein
MKKILIDINILMDFLFKREGHEKVAEIFKICSKGDIQGLVCAHEITTLNYFLDKTIKDKVKVRKTISGIMQHFKIIEVNRELLEKALTSEIDDFEDAVIEASSSKEKAEYILTRNIRDCKKSIIHAIAPEELLVIYNNRNIPNK